MVGKEVNSSSFGVRVHHSYRSFMLPYVNDIYIYVTCVNKLQRNRFVWSQAELHREIHDVIAKGQGLWDTACLWSCSCFDLVTGVEKESVAVVPFDFLVHGVWFSCFFSKEPADSVSKSKVSPPCWPAGFGRTTPHCHLKSPAFSTGGSQMRHSWSLFSKESFHFGCFDIE